MTTSTSPASTTLSLDERTRDSLHDLLGAAALLLAQRERDMRLESRWKVVWRLGLILLAALSLGMWWGLYSPLLGVPAGAPTRDAVVVLEVAGPIGGDARATADRLVPLIDTACDSTSTKALVLRINSPGGSPTDAERVSAAITGCRGRRPTLPIVAAIEGTGASAAYLIASSADTVLASRYSLVGSLGAVLRSLDASAGLERLGLRERVFASGPLKAGGSMITPNTREQDALYQQVIDQIAQAFTNQVRANRSGRLLQHTPDLFSGRVWVAEDAMQIGLVDEVVLLDDWLRREYRDLPRHTLRPTRTLQDQMTLEAVASSVVDQLTTRGPSLEVR